MVEVERATFQEVKRAQQELIFKFMLSLEDSNSFIDSKDREGFWDAFDIATLGEASRDRFMLKTPLFTEDMGSVSEFAREMIFFEPTEDGKAEIKARGNTHRISMRLLWKALREQLVRPMDRALSKAHGASAELLTHPRDGFAVGDKIDDKRSKTD